MYGCFACMYVHYVPGNLNGQERALDALGLELQMVASCQVGTGNETQALCENKKCS